MNTKMTFESTVVGGIEVKNRIFRSATYEGTAEDGVPDQKMYEMYENLSRGEVGLIITGYIDRKGVFLYLNLIKSERKS